MAYREALSQQVIAISISDSPDMPLLGLSEQHLSDAMTEISRHLLALGSRIVYGGDLRINGFTSLLFELVSRHRRDADEGDERPSVLNYLAWPVHMQKDEAELIALSNHLSGMAELVLFDRDGSQLQLPHHQAEGRRSCGEAQVCQLWHPMLFPDKYQQYKNHWQWSFFRCQPGVSDPALMY